MKIRTIQLFLLLVSGWITTPAVYGQFTLDLESGAVVSSPYNEARVPNATGTTIDLAKDMKTQPAIFFRLRAGYTFGRRHTVSALLAPLSVKSKGGLNKNVNYNGVLFPIGTNLESTFKFNTYRLTYRYNVLQTNRFRLGLGITGLLRDASIRLRSETSNTAFDNVGIVPLLHYNLWWNPIRRLLILSEADASYSRFGQAFDVFAGVAYRITPTTAIKAGYRVIEGGTNVDTVYTSSWLNFASVGLLFTFGKDENE